MTTLKKNNQDRVHVVSTQPTKKGLTGEDRLPAKVKAEIIAPVPRQPSIYDGLVALPTWPTVVLPDSYNSINKLEMLRMPAGEARQSTKRFSTYETFVGVSNDTPELLSIVNFAPLVKQGSGNVSITTDAGRYLDDQVLMRDLRIQNIVSMINELSLDSDVEDSIQKRIEAFGQSLYSIQTTISFLLDAVFQVERVKSFLDLKNDAHRVDPGEVIASYYNFRSFLAAGSELKNSAAVQPFDIPDVLTQLGFNAESASKFYSSTKLWLQMLLEYKEIVRTHSLGLTDSVLPSYRNDRSPGTLVKPTKNRFDVQLISTYTLNQLDALETNQLETAVQGLATSYSGMYVSAQFKSDEHRVSALAAIASREFRLSRGLGRSDVQMILKEFGYTVVPFGNVAVLDAFIGTFGDNIGDVPEQASTSLAGCALQRPDDQTVVLTFEEKYVQGDNGTLVPGSEYYVDNVLKTDGTSFNTERLVTLGTKFSNIFRAFSSLTTGLNLTMNPTAVIAGKGSVFDDPYANPRLLYESLVVRFMNGSGEMSNGLRDDPICGLFAYAQGPKGNKIKAILFTIVASLIRRVETSTTNQFTQFLSEGFRDTVVSELATMLERSLFIDFQKDSHSAFRGTTRTVAASKIIDGLKGSSPAIKLVGQVLNECRTLFERDAFVEGRTRYSGYTNTIVLMVVFDLITTLMGKYSTQRLMGVVNDNRTRSYTFTTEGGVQSTSIVEITTRLNREALVNSQVVYAVLNTMTKTAVTMGALHRSLNSDEWKNNLSFIRSVVEPKLIETLFSKQQIMMLASNVNDLKLGNTTQGFASFSQNAFIDVDGDGDYDFKDGLRVCDDALVPPKLRNAIVGFLSNNEFSTEKAINKRILTVGIPVGLSDHVNRLVRVKTTNYDSFQDKQSDVFYINIHKIDMRNPDVIYRPLKRLVELSRFPVRSILEQPTFQDIDDYVNRFPTRDYSQKYETIGGAADVQYLVPNAAQTGAFTDDSYSFLSHSQRREIIYNTVSSFVMETYIQLMSGLDVREPSWSAAPIGKLIDDTFLQTLTQASVAHVLSKRDQPPAERGTTFFGSRPSLTRSDVVSRTRRSLKGPKTIDPATLDDETIATLTQFMATLDNTSRIMTPLVDDISLKKALLSPKKFDRVFSFMIDPDDFEIDTKATYQTSEGRTAVRQLVESGVFSMSGDLPSETTLRLVSSAEVYVPKKRDTKQGDIAFERYFITISTMNEEVI